MTTTMGSLDLSALNNLYDETQYFWFESSAQPWGAGAHVTLYPQSEFTTSTHANYLKGQNILMNTDGFSIRNGTLPMMTLDNDSLDFNVVDTTAGTFVTTATFTSTGAQIGQNGAAHSVIDADGQRFYASDGTTQLANIGYGEGNTQSGTSTSPYYTFGVRDTTGVAYNSSATYDIGDMCVYNDKIYVCRYNITTPESWTSNHWQYYIGNYSHAEGRDTISTGYVAHAEGFNTIAMGSYSHAEGNNTTARGSYSHAQNSYTIAQGYCQTVIGTYNVAQGTPSSKETTDHAFIIGNGTSTTRSNAFTVDWSGNVVADGDLTLKGHSSPIGKIEVGEETTKSNSATATWVEGSSVDLSNGVWVITAHVNFAQNSTGRRVIAIYSGSSQLSASVINQSPTSGAITHMVTTYILSTSGSTVSIRHYQTSGGQLSATSIIRAVRIK